MRNIPQKIDDIEIPDIQIDEGWPVSDVKTIEDCDDAYAFLMSACAAIEYSIDIEDAKPEHMRDLHWRARAKCALKYKKAALGIVTATRSKIKSQKQDERDKVLLNFIRSRVSDAQFFHWIEASGCNKILDDAA